MPRLAAEHFCPLWPNAERTRSVAARSRSACSVTTRAFLPLVSANRRSSGFHVRNNVAVSHEPGEDHGVGGFDETAAGVVVGRAHELQHVARHARRPARLGDDLGAPRRLRRGLEDHGVAGGERSADPAGGDRHREVPRRHHGHHSERGVRHVGEVLELEPAVAVPPGEVDGFAHLGVTLGVDLGGLRRHRGDELPAPRWRARRRPGRASPGGPRRRAPTIRAGRRGRGRTRRRPRRVRW